MSVDVVHGDCLELLPTLAEASIDACVTDPPYGLSFMGKNWDHGVPGVPFWKVVLRVLKPGGHLLAFGGSRTYHRLACAIEDAGFEIRDQIMWLYGSGFPKSHDVSKGIDKAAGAKRPVVGTRRAGITPTEQEKMRPITAAVTDAARKWDGWGTALKPAHEPIVMARKPLIGTVAANVLAHGTGALNVDGCRVESNEDDENHRAPSIGYKNGFPLPTGESKGRPCENLNKAGRWPANVIHDGSAEVVEGFPESNSSEGLLYRRESLGYESGINYVGRKEEIAGYAFGDRGSAARFFYSAKADKAERISSKHPTVKPIDLMAYLCRLVTPPGGTVLDSFAGSGATGMACMREGFDAILIEREAEYVADIKRRIDHVAGEDAPLFSGVMA